MASTLLFGSTEVSGVFFGRLDLLFIANVDRERRQSRRDFLQSRRQGRAALALLVVDGVCERHQRHEHLIDRGEQSEQPRTTSTLATISATRRTEHGARRFDGHAEMSVIDLQHRGPRIVIALGERIRHVTRVIGKIVEASRDCDTRRSMHTNRPKKQGNEHCPRAANHHVRRVLDRIER